jgi:hypothetical protein
MGTLGLQLRLRIGDRRKRCHSQRFSQLAQKHSKVAARASVKNHVASQGKTLSDAIIMSDQMMFE